MTRTPMTWPARFNDDAWHEDVVQTTKTGRAVACAARRRYNQVGVPSSELRPVDEEGTDGTILPRCVKVYLPPSNGRFGMVFRVTRAKTA